MSSHSHIQWTEATWSPTVGCTHVSAGCDNCYAATLASGRLKHLPEYAGLAEHGNFNGTVRLLEDRLTLPLKWRKPRMIFVDSMSDLFHESVPDEYLVKVWATMAAAPRHTFQILTKRHGRMRSVLSRADFRASVWDYWRALTHGANDDWAWPLPGVWLGVSAEDQHWADVRIPALLSTPAAVRFMSAEPLLGSIDLGWHVDLPMLDWVIVGGESGRRARPMQLDWARSIRDQCQEACVAFFMKQTGSVLARQLGITGKGDDPAQWPEAFAQEYPDA